MTLRSRFARGLDVRPAPALISSRWALRFSRAYSQVRLRLRISSRSIQSLPNLVCEFLEGKRLADHMNAGVEAPVMDNRVSGVAGHEQNFQIRSQPQGLIGELATVDAARHHYVSQQKIHPLVAFEGLERCRTFARLHHAIP